jgi:dihydrofolate reductase
LRALVVQTFLTLDGVMQAPGGPGEDDDGGFAHGGWSNSVPLEGDAAGAPANLKAEDGPELQVHGSGNLIQTLLAHNLVDRFRLWVFPVVLGSGKRLFADGTVPAGLRLVDHQVSSTGVVMGTWEPAGEVVTGSF